MALFLAPVCSFRFSGVLGTEANDAGDASWRCRFTAWVYLAAKPPHVGLIWMG
jgi:hypothetical protein